MRSRILILPLIAVVAALYFWWAASPAAPRLAATWRVGTGSEIEQGQNYDEFAAESPVRLSVVCDEPHHLYVFSYSDEDGTLLLFPSPDIESDCANPLPAGRTVLPGEHEGEELAWTTRSGIVGLTTFVAIASREPIPELETLGDRLRRWSTRVFPDGAMVVTKAASGEDFAGKPRTGMPHALLRAAAELANTQANPNGPMQRAEGWIGVYLSAWKIRERKKSTPQGK